MNKYKKGQILVDKDGNKRKVLEVLGDLVFSSYVDNHEKATASYSYKEIDQNYTVEQEKCDREEWGGWKFVSDMLDNPDECGLYKTSKCYQQLYDFVIEQKIREIDLFMKAIQERANTIPPNLILNEVVNYAYDRIKKLK